MTSTADRDDLVSSVDERLREVARTVREEGVWSLVRLGDDREGWLETDHLEPIARPWANGRR